MDGWKAERERGVCECVWDKGRQAWRITVGEWNAWVEGRGKRAGECMWGKLRRA